jgi:hypothetical protein
MNPIFEEELICLAKALARGIAKPFLALELAW